MLVEILVRLNQGELRRTYLRINKIIALSFVLFPVQIFQKQLDGTPTRCWIAVRISSHLLRMQCNDGANHVLHGLNSDRPRSLTGFLAPDNFSVQIN